MSDTHKSGRCPSDPRPDPKGRCYGSEGLVVRLKSMLGHHEIRLGPGCERLERFQHTLQYLKIEGSRRDANQAARTRGPCVKHEGLISWHPLSWRLEIR
jgi:hypothetical protein